MSHFFFITFFSLFFFFFFFFFFNDTATTEIYTLSLHDALPISTRSAFGTPRRCFPWMFSEDRSEEHTSELQSLTNLVCRLLLEKKKKKTNNTHKQKTPNHITNQHTPS